MLRAAADIVVNQGLQSLTLVRVAEQAGVSKRTLYNYFDSRETLLSELCTWHDELTLELGGYLMPGRLEALPEMARAVWRTWAAEATVFQAVLKIQTASGDVGMSGDRLRRRAAIAAGIAEIRPDLPAGHVQKVAAVFHGLIGTPLYERLTQDGLDVETAGALVEWVLSLMHEGLVRHKDPDLPAGDG